MADDSLRAAGGEDRRSGEPRRQQWTTSRSPWSATWSLTRCWGPSATTSPSPASAWPRPRGASTSPDRSGATGKPSSCPWPAGAGWRRTPPRRCTRATASSCKAGWSPAASTTRSSNGARCWKWRRCPSGRTSTVVRRSWSAPPARRPASGPLGRAAAERPRVHAGQRGVRGRQLGGPV